MTLNELRKTRPERAVALIRLMLGSLFVLTGLMKFVVPALAEAWSGQLLAADLPLYTLTRWTVPFVEIAVGLVLLVGLLARPAGVVVMAIMAVATYVHVIVDDSALFPLTAERTRRPGAGYRSLRLCDMARCRSLESGSEGNRLRVSTSLKRRLESWSRTHRLRRGGPGADSLGRRWARA